ncbi:hypothetical protein RYX36_034894 [Vicia faba]
MIGVCDKLIGVFLVDKPTPIDWRRLSAFRRDWNNIRPLFFCTRHGDLLDVISTDLSEISNVVSNYRKDFTNEFFEHLYVVTESYRGDAVKKIEVNNGATVFFEKFINSYKLTYLLIKFHNISIFCTIHIN